MPHGKSRLTVGTFLMRNLSSILIGLLIIVAPAFASELNVTVVSITSKVPPGGVVTLVVRTQPGATCQGMRQDHFGSDIPLTREGSKMAGKNGLVTWNWRVLSGNHPVGRRDLSVTCSLGERSGTVRSFFSVE
jgi:hypothetical protein